MATSLRLIEASQPTWQDRDYDDFTMLKGLLDRPDSAAVWGPLFQHMCPEDFGKVVGDVNLEFDQPKVAELLGRRLAGGVTAAHVIAANSRAARNQAPAIIKKLAPMCVDFKDHVGAIESRLSDWDRIVAKGGLHPVYPV